MEKEFSSRNCFHFGAHELGSDIGSTLAGLSETDIATALEI